MGISIWQLVIILAIVLVLFGAKRLRNVGSDLGAAVKGFKTAVKDGDKKEEVEDAIKNIEGKERAANVIEGEVVNKDKV
jgi:sec-independent protein translocase protein TatA